MMNQTDQVTTWDTSSEPSTFDPQDWFQYVQRVRGRAVPPVSDLVVLSVINPPLSDVHAELVEQRYGRRVEDFALSGHPFVVIEHEGHQVTVCTSSKGSYSAGAVDELIALGAKKIVLLNVGAALSEEPEVGHYVSATSALRDDGVSNNYLPPSRFIEGSPSLCASLTQMGDGKVHSGAVWTNVAHFRLAVPRVQAFRAEGCLLLDNEVAGIYAVAKARGVEAAALVFNGLTMATNRIEVPESHGVMYDEKTAAEHFDLALAALVNA